MRYLIVATSSSPALERAERVFSMHAQGSWRSAEFNASGETIRVFFERPDSSHVPPRVPIHESQTQLVLYDGFPLHPEFDAFDARSLEDSACWDQLIGRFAIVRFSKADGSLEIIIDPIGGCQCYHADLADGWALTNIPLIAHTLAEKGDLDVHGASGLLCAPAPYARLERAIARAWVPNERGDLACTRVTREGPVDSCGEEPIRHVARSGSVGVRVGVWTDLPSPR